MSAATTATTTTAAAAAAIAQATKASGVIVHLEPREFSILLARAGEVLVVCAPPRGPFARRHSYLFSHRGLAFYTRSVEPIELAGADIVMAKSIWAP